MSTGNPATAAQYINYPFEKMLVEDQRRMFADYRANIAYGVLRYHF